ncbi:MAG TPA: flavodoxin domain-containing protein [Candidatus Angelobacter sp.]|nr:flavodoxin domain-containing protein [Candidatus Angelobacter sp.]
MHTLVVYASTSGNTRRVAEAMAEALSSRGPVELLMADGLTAELPPADVVFIGGPTEGHAMTRPMSRLLERVPAETWRGRAVAAFDTRLRWPRFLSGSAAVDIAERLEAAGALLVAEPESFMVSMKPMLEPGERERAGTWALGVAEAAQRAEAPVR